MSDLEKLGLPVKSNDIEAKTNPEKGTHFFWKHKIAIGLGATAAIAAGLLVFASNNQEFAEDNCSDLEQAQIDVNADATSLASISRTFIHRNSQNFTLVEFTEGISKERQYYINPEAVKDLNPKLASFMERTFPTMVYCAALPQPEIKKVGDTVLVYRYKPDNLNQLITGANGKADPAVVAAMASLNAEQWAVNNFEQLPELGYYPPSGIDWVKEHPTMTEEAIVRTREQAEALGFIGQ